MVLPPRGSPEPSSVVRRTDLPSTRTHPQRPRPGRRRSMLLLPRFATIPIALLITIILITTFPSCSQATFSSLKLRRLAERGEIEIDRRPPPAAEFLSPRQFDDSSSTSSTSTSTSTSASLGPASTASSTSAPTSTTAIDTAPSGTQSSAPLPTPFDTSIGSNFTSNACPDFFNKFLANATFQQCHPMSLLLENSNSFFQASGSAVLLTQALDASCSANLDTCAAVMKELAGQLISDDHCGADFNEQNPLVVQAHSGLVAYQPVYQATCLKSAKSGQYCFVDAMSASDNLSDTYPFYLGIGINLPGGSRPTCDKCLQDIMGIFAQAARDKNQPVSQTYTTAAQQIDLGCGATFVNSTVPVATTQSGGAEGLLYQRSGMFSLLVSAAIGAFVLL